MGLVGTTDRSAALTAENVPDGGQRDAWNGHRKAHSGKPAKSHFMTWSKTRPLSFVLEAPPPQRGGRTAGPMRGQGPQARRDGALAGGTAQLPAPPRRPLVTSTVPPPQTDEQRGFEQEKRSQVENSKLLSDLQKWVRTARTSFACARIATSIDAAQHRVRFAHVP